MFYRYLVFERDNNGEKYPYPCGVIYARTDQEAWDLWESYAVDGPHRVTVEYCEEEQQIPSVRSI